MKKRDNIDRIGTCLPSPLIQTEEGDGWWVLWKLASDDNTVYITEECLSVDRTTQSVTESQKSHPGAQWLTLLAYFNCGSVVNITVKLQPELIWILWQRPLSTEHNVNSRTFSLWALFRLKCNIQCATQVRKYKYSPFCSSANTTTSSHHVGYIYSTYMHACHVCASFNSSLFALLVSPPPFDLSLALTWENCCCVLYHWLSERPVVEWGHESFYTVQCSN